MGASDEISSVSPWMRSLCRPNMEDSLITIDCRMFGRLFRYVILVVPAFVRGFLLLVDDDTLSFRDG